MPVRPLSPELAEKARVELNEDPKRLESDLQHIRDWLEKQPHIRARRDHWRGKVQQYSSWLDEEKTFGTDEQKRPGPPKTAETLFGVDGSFRQLNFD